MTVPSSDEQVTDFSEAPRGYLFHGFHVHYDWASVEDDLGRKRDVDIAATLGCTPLAVRKVRKMLGIPAYKRALDIRPLAGRYPDAVVAKLVGCARETVTRFRKAEGIAPCNRKRLTKIRYLRRQVALRRQ